MASRSIHEIYSREEIEQMQQFLRENPIDHQYDEVCRLFDGDPPMAQVLARVNYEILQELGELPDDIPG